MLKAESGQDKRNEGCQETKTSNFIAAYIYFPTMKETKPSRKTNLIVQLGSQQTRVTLVSPPCV